MVESKNRLNSWKEIAHYLKCDESTARRRERENSLPIYRAGGKGHSVYAFSEELDAWLRGQPGEDLAKMPEIRADISEGCVAVVGSAPSTADAGQIAQPVRSRAERISTRSSIGWVRYPLLGAVAAAAVAATLWLSVDGSMRQQHRSKPSARFTDVADSSGSQANVQAGVSGNDNASSDKIPEAEIFQLKKLVKESQVWEMLTLYSTPWICDAHNLERYWQPGSPAFVAVGESASRLNERGVHYGFGARLLNFEYRYVRISQDGLSAEVGTREHWWLPVYTRDETPIANRNPDQGPYEIDYLLVKVGGHWYLRSTTTPYTQWKPQQITCRNWPSQTIKVANVDTGSSRKQPLE